MQITIKQSNIKFQIEKPEDVFGGGHETTKFMLDCIDKYGVKGKSVIDIGTGSGVISVYAKKCGAKSVLAVDNNSHALEYASKNFKKNNVEVELRENDLLTGCDDKADIIIANLPSSVQLINICSVGEHLNNNGLLFITWAKMFANGLLLNLGYRIVEHIEGEEYDGYVLKKE